MKLFYSSCHRESNALRRAQAINTALAKAKPVRDNKSKMTDEHR